MPPPPKPASHFGSACQETGTHGPECAVQAEMWAGAAGSAGIGRGAAGVLLEVRVTSQCYGRKEVAVYRNAGVTILHVIEATRQLALGAGMWASAERPSTPMLRQYGLAGCCSCGVLVPSGARTYISTSRRVSGALVPLGPRSSRGTCASYRRANETSCALSRWPTLLEPPAPTLNFYRVLPPVPCMPCGVLGEPWGIPLAQTGVCVETLDPVRVWWTLSCVWPALHLGGMRPFRRRPGDSVRSRREQGARANLIP